MILKDFFINLSVFSFLISTAIIIQVFIIRKNLKSSYLIGGCYASIVAVIPMLISVRYNEYFFDLRFIPLILSFVYFGHKAGWITAICIFIARIYIGGHWIPGEVILGETILLFTLFKVYFKKISTIKRAFLYLAIHLIIYIFTLEFFSVIKTTVSFHIVYSIFVSLGLLLGVLLIEAHNKLYCLTQDLSHLNQTLANSKQELKDMVHEQQGGIFTFKKVNECFIHTLCDGQFYYRHSIHPEQVVGKNLEIMDPSVAPPHLVPQLLEYYQEAWEGKEVTFEIAWPNNKTFIFISLRPVKREGKVIEVVGSVVDITKRKEMEDELRTTKERLESFISHNIDAIIISDLEGHIVQANKAYEEMLGWSVYEILGQKLPCVPDFLRGRAVETIGKIVSGESTITKLETVRQRKDGSLIDVNLTLSPILDSSGNIIALSASYRDISERKKAERELQQLHQQLKESEMKYRELFENAIDAVYLLELNEERFPTRFLEVNPVGCERFGYSREEILLIPFVDIVPQDSTLLIRMVKEIKEGKRSFTLQDEYVFKTGKTIHLEFSVCIFTLDRKEVLLAISRDITERLKTEELLRKSEKLAVVGQLATAIAHEINNPLTTVKGFIQLLKSMENKDKHNYIELVLSEIDKIESITREFMVVAKPQAVKVEPKDLHILIEQVIMLLQPQARMNNVQIRTDFRSDIPLIPCEANQVKQVFINILKNSIEAMPMGGDILIQVDKADNHQVSIQFIDQGHGIPKERIPYLGEPFYSIKEEGIGLGLMVCYKIVEAHQGKIVIKSEVNKGSTVDVILPIHPLLKQKIHWFSDNIEMT